MTCKQVEALVMPYIQGTLSDEELEPFLEHLENCQSCQDELEIYYIVDVGISQLDDGDGSDDIKGNLEKAIEGSKQWLYYKRIRKIICYSVNTLSFFSLIIMLLLQFRIWWQFGI